MNDSRITGPLPIPNPRVRVAASLAALGAVLAWACVLVLAAVPAGAAARVGELGAPDPTGAFGGELFPAGVGAGAEVVPAADGAFRVQFDPNQRFTEENQLVTSVPGTFTGVSVAGLIGADRFYAAGITGQGTSVGNVEAGQIWNGHETLGQVTTYVSDAATYHTVAGQPEYDRHATWVGMMIGARTAAGLPYQTGIAPDTDLRSGAIATGWGAGSAYMLSFSATTATRSTAYNAFFGTTDVINSSWGGTDTTGTTVRALIPDGLQNQNPHTTFVAVAGNGGSGSNTVVSPGAGYNVITVAALQNTGANVYDSVATFSSRGPQDYYDPVHGTLRRVRAAVDLAAPGTNLTSAFYGGQTGGNNPTLSGSIDTSGSDLYSGSLTGTSFAAPITAGAVALLDSGSKADAALAGNANARDARVIKAVLQNSADKIPGWNNGQTSVGGVIETTQSLDWASGAGALDLDRAYDQYLAAGTRDLLGPGGGTLSTVGWDYGAVGIGQTNSYLIDQILRGGTTLTATLDWFRDRTWDAVNYLYQDIAQANLDLIIRNVTTGVVARSISLYNVVEHLSFVVPETGQYAIDVLYTGNSFGNIGSEEYGLAWWSVPVPGTLALLLGGAAALAVRRRSVEAHPPAHGGGPGGQL